MKPRERVTLFAATGLALVGAAVLSQLQPSSPPVLASEVPAGAGPQAPGAAAATTAAVETPAPIEPRRRVVPIDWLGDRPAAVDDDDPAQQPRADAYRGQLVVGAALQPLPAAPLRLTHAWLQSALPQPHENTAQARRGAPLLLPWRGETNVLGLFSLPAQQSRRALFLVVDPDGPMEDIVMLRRRRWWEGTVELGTIVLQERGAVRGALVGAGTRQGARVRAFDIPLEQRPLSAAARDDALRAAAVVHDQRRWLSGGEVMTIPAWIRRRDAMLPFPTVTTDAEGRFDLPSIRPGTVRLVVQTADGVDVLRDVTVEPRRTTEVTLALPDVDLVPLRLLDDRDRPVDASVVVVPPDANAALVRSVLPPRRTENGVLMADRRALEDGEVLLQRARSWPWETCRTEQDEAGHFVRLAPLGGFRVRVQSVRGEVVRGATATLLGDDGPFGAAGPPPADALQPRQVAPGEWRSDALPSQSYRLLVRAENHAPALRRVVPVAVEPPSYTVHLFPTFAIDIRVVDAQGAAVAGTEVTALPHAADQRNRFFEGTAWPSLVEHPVRVGTTDADGRVQADGVWDNSFSFAARHPTLGVGVQRVRQPRAGASIEIRLVPDASIRGWLTERGGPPSESWLVTAQPTRQLVDRYDGHRGIEPVTARVDGDGGFVVTGLLPGPWEMQITRPHAAHRAPPRLRQRIDVRAGAEEYVELDLDASPLQWVLSGHVRLNGVFPIDAVAVLERTEADRAAAIERRLEKLQGRKASGAGTFDEELRALAGRWTAPPVRSVARIDQYGRYEFEAVPPGGAVRLSIERTRDGKVETLASQWVTVEPWRRTTIDVDIATGTTRAQLVTRRGPCRNRELRATLVGSEPELAFQVVSDAAGEIVLRDLPAGDYDLRLADLPEGPAARCTVAPGEDRSVQLMFE